MHILVTIYISSFLKGGKIYYLYYKEKYTVIPYTLNIDMEIIDAPAFKIRINKVGRYFRIHDILPECILPNIQLGDVIVSIGHRNITNDLSLEAIRHILQEHEDSIKVVKYGTAVQMHNRAFNAAQREVNGDIDFIFHFDDFVINVIFIFV